MDSGRDSQPTSCPVKCSKPMENGFCLRLIQDPFCASINMECCLEREMSIDTMTKNFLKLVQQSVALNETKNIGTELSQVSSTTSPPPPALPTCDGTCVIPLFSLLCDEIDSNQFCPNGGSCCVNREPTTMAPPITNCPGSCIPVILSGMCTKPYELILKTIDCESGHICCADKKDLDFDSGSANLDNLEPAKPPSTVIFPDSKPSFLSPRPLPPNIANFGQPNHQPHPIPPMQPKPFVNRNKLPLPSGEIPPGVVVPNFPGSVLKDPAFIGSGNNPVIVDPMNQIPYRLPESNEHLYNSKPVESDEIKKNYPNKLDQQQQQAFPCPGTCMSPMFR